MAELLNDWLSMTTADKINMGLLVVTSIGAFCAWWQIRNSNKQKRADLILQLCTQFYDDGDMQEIYYRIEYGEFEYETETFHQSEDEKKLDKLLGLFSNIGQLYQMGIINKSDLEFIRYEFQIIYQYPAVQNYFQVLDGWFKARNINHFKFQPFRDVGQMIVEDN